MSVNFTDIFLFLKREKNNAFLTKVSFMKLDISHWICFFAKFKKSKILDA